MATALKPRPAVAERAGDPTDRADAFVSFGITGDLAKVMTFHSLYRLERRGLLDCPIVGVAVSDWSVDELREHARAAIEGCGEQIDDDVFDRFAARLSYVSGDFGGASTFDRVKLDICDALGALRDVVVNHLMQVVGAAAMEPPAARDSRTLKDSLASVYRTIAAADPAQYVRGQYEGYRSIDGVASDSTTETYAALRL